MSTDQGTHERTSRDGPGQVALLELTEVLSCADDGQLMRRLLNTILQALIDAEAAQHIGADPHERTDTRTTLRKRHPGQDRLHDRW